LLRVVVYVLAATALFNKFLNTSVVAPLRVLIYGLEYLLFYILVGMIVCFFFVCIYPYIITTIMK